MKRLCFLYILLIINCFALEKARIGFVFDGKEVKQDPFVSKVKREIKSLLEEEYITEFEDFYGDFTIEGAKKALDKALLSDVDVVVSLGFLTSFEALELKNLKKPIVMSYDVQLFQENPDKKTYSNKLAYFKGKTTFHSQIQQFMKVTHAKTIGVISDSSLLRETKAKELFVKAIETGGGQVVFIPVNTKITGALKTIEKENIDGVIFLPTPRLSQEKFDELVNNLQIPSFSFVGEEEVDKGVLMTMTPKSEKLRLARRIALNVQEMLFSKDNSEIVVDFYRTSEVVLNESVMNRLVLDFNWDFLAEAKLIGKVEIPKSKILNLKQAIDIALRNNLNLDAERYVVKSGYEQVKITQAPLLPQGVVSASNQVVDRNTALYSRGLAPNNSISGSLRFSQLIYDERLVSAFDIEKYLQLSREYDKERVELNVVLFAAVYYIDVLKIESEKEIAQENIDLSKANLKRAYELVESGEKRKSEIYRWESELSINKDTLADVQAKLENRKADFNQILNRPIPEEVNLEKISLFDPILFEKILKLMKHTETPAEFEKFKETLICLSRKRVPEIKVFEEKVLARKRKLKATKRAFILPSVFAFADLNKFLAKQGIGSRPPDGVSNNALSTTVGVTISYPLVTGGARIADKNKALYDLRTTEIRKDEVTQSADVRVVKAIDQLKSSYDQIFFSKKAKEASDQNLNIVTNSYTRGLVSIVDLLDAQNNAIVSRLSYSNSVHDFLIDYMVLQRAVGDFDGFFVDKKTQFDDTVSIFLGDNNES